MKLNKVLSLVVVVVMLFTLSTFAAYQDVKSDASYAEAVDVLSALKILNGYEDGSFKPDGKITRGEFSKVVAGAIGMAESAKANATGGIFKDVAADLWSSGYIATAYQAGIVNGMGDGTFAPEAEVTYDQAVKMLVAALGYTPKATALGGYPTGYMMVANQEGITVGTANAAGGASRATVARLVYNALTVPMMDQTSFGNDAAFEKIDNQSLLYTKLNVVKADCVINSISLDKTVTDVTISDVELDDVATADKFVVDTTPLINGVDLKGLQGLMVSALIDVSDDNDQKLISVVKKAGKNKELVISPKLFKDTNETSDGYVTYYKTSDDDKTSKEQLETLTVYNNLVKGDVITTTAVDDDQFKYSAGDVSYKFVDTDNDGKYDKLFVSNEKSFVIGSVNTTSNKIFRETSNSNAMYTFNDANIQLDPEDDSVNWSLKDAAGKDLTIADLKAGQVANVKKSTDGGFDFYDIVITDAKVEGTISEVYSETNKVLPGTTTFYKIGDKAYETVTSVTLNPGDIINATLNNSGKIIIYTVSDGVRNYAVVTGTDINESFTKEPQVQVMTQKGEIVTLDFAKTVTVDGVSKTTSTDFDTITELNAVLDQGDLFIYELNASGEIKTIYTTTAGISAKDTAMKFVTINETYRASSEKLGSNYIVDSSVIFAVKTATLTDKKDLSLSSKSLFVDEDLYKGLAVVKDGDVQAIVLFNAGNNVKPDSFPMVVTSKATTSVDGDSRTKLKGLVNGEEVEYVGEEDFAAIENVVANDVIQFTLNGNKEISNITTLVEYTGSAFVVADNGNLGGTAGDDNKDAVAGKTVTLNLADTYTVGAATAAFKGFAAAGKAYDVKGRILRLINQADMATVYGLDGTKTYGLNDAYISDFYVNSSAVAYIYNVNTKKIKATTIADLETDKSTNDYATKGTDNDDLVYVYNYDGETYMMLIIDTDGDN